MSIELEPLKESTRSSYVNHTQQKTEEPTSPPVARKQLTTYHAHGDQRQCFYSWLSNPGDPDTRAYIDEWNQYTSEMMRPYDKLMSQLYDEYQSQEESEGVSLPFRVGGYDYYYKYRVGEGDLSCCRKKNGGDQEEILLSANKNINFLEFDDFSVLNMQPSPDGKYVAFIIGETGSSYGKITIKCMETGYYLNNIIPKCDREIVWSDNSSFFWYIKVDETLRKNRLCVHYLKSGTTNDPILYLEKDNTFDLSISKDGDKLIVISKSFDTTETRFFNVNRPKKPCTIVRTREDGVRYKYIPGNKKDYILFSRDGSKHAIFTVDSDCIDKKLWGQSAYLKEEWNVDDAKLIGNHLVMIARKDAIQSIFRYSRFGSDRIELPIKIGKVSFEPGEYGPDLFRWRIESPVYPPEIYETHIKSLESTRVLHNSCPDFNPSDYVSERIWTQANDRTIIPISIFYKKGMSRDGSASLCLQAYGAYGCTDELSFNEELLPLLNRGVCYAIAHVRGGGALGYSWHRQGAMLKKMNTFTDFIACTEHLIQQQYTSPATLVIQGHSAGGLVVGAVANMRPELFNACLADVPFVDLLTVMSDKMQPETTKEWREWGNPAIESYYRYMKKYSPIDNVISQRYPAMFVTAGYKDRQVPYDGIAKYVATLMDNNAGDNPIFFRVNMCSGHQRLQNRFAYHSKLAEKMAFLLIHLGLLE